VATLQHLADLFFDGSYEATRKRLKALEGDGLTAKRARPIGVPAVLFLTAKGYRLAKREAALDGLPLLDAKALGKRVQVSELTLNHELDVLTLRAAFERAVADRADLTVTHFVTWPRLIQFRASRPLREVGLGPSMLYRPDGFIELLDTSTQRRMFFFVEVDRSTEVLATLATKMHGYGEFWRGGGFARRLGGPDAQPKQYPVRVLWTFKSEARLRNVSRAFAGQTTGGGGGLAWLATFADATSDPLGRVWSKPGEAPASRGLL
jgi:hypothetical protein